MPRICASPPGVTTMFTTTEALAWWSIRREAGHGGRQPSTSSRALRWTWTSALWEPLFLTVLGMRWRSANVLDSSQPRYFKDYQYTQDHDHLAIMGTSPYLWLPISPPCAPSSRNFCWSSTFWTTKTLQKLFFQQPTEIPRPSVYAGALRGE